MINKIITFGLALVIGDKLLTETERHLYPNAPRSFWGHIKDFVGLNRTQEVQKR